MTAAITKEKAQKKKRRRIFKPLTAETASLG
jgi:hypothetical protein